MISIGHEKYLNLDELPFPKEYWWSYSAYDNVYLPLEEVALKVFEYGDIEEILNLYKIFGAETVNGIYSAIKSRLYEKDKYLIKIIDMISELFMDNLRN